VRSSHTRGDSATEELVDDLLDLGGVLGALVKTVQDGLLPIDQQRSPPAMERLSPSNVLMSRGQAPVANVVETTSRHSTCGLFVCILIE
jgi:hypothetical protein